MDYSGAEQFVLAMKALPNVTLVGETTAGCLSAMQAMPLPSGAVFYMSYQVITSPDGKQYEKTGIPPDIEEKMTKAQWFDGEDPILQKALDLAQKQ